MVEVDLNSDLSDIEPEALLPRRACWLRAGILELGGLCSNPGSTTMTDSASACPCALGPLLGVMA